jgi:hypothetical protein
MAVLAAVAGVLLPGDDVRVSLALFAFAVALGLVVSILLVADGVRHRRRRRGAAHAAQSPLRRLEYLPPVTTATRRIRWRGARPQVMRRQSTVSTAGRGLGAPAVAGPDATPPVELTGSAARTTRVG